MDILDIHGKVVDVDSFIIRATEVSQYLNCPRNWFVQSHNGLNLEPPLKPQKLRFGTIWHLAMEYLYSGKDPFQGIEDGIRHELDLIHELLAVDPDVHQGVEEDKLLLYSMLKSYMEWRNSEADPTDDMFKVYSVEERFVVPFNNDTPYYLVAKLDAILEDRSGGLWVLEHKTRSKGSSVTVAPDLQLDMQTGLQLLVCKHAFPDKTVKGVIYNLARKQALTSRVRSPVFGRHEIFRSKSELDILEIFLNMLAADMKRDAARDKTDMHCLRYNPNTFGICTWGCSVKDVCEAMIRGEDVDYLIETGLRPRSKTIFEVLEEDMTKE